MWGCFQIFLSYISWQSLDIFLMVNQWWQCTSCHTNLIKGFSLSAWKFVEEHSCCNSRICLERFKIVALRSFSKLISQKEDFLTLLSSFSAGVVPILLPTSALPTSLDITFLSSPMVLLGSCSLILDIFKIYKLKTNLYH